MGEKQKRGNREQKKKPATTAKEKRNAKAEKKHPSPLSVVPPKR